MTRLSVAIASLLFLLASAVSIFAQEAHPPEARPEGHQEEAKPEPHPETKAPPPRQAAPPPAAHPEQAKPAPHPEQARPAPHPEQAKPAPHPEQARPTPQAKPAAHPQETHPPAQAAKPAPPPHETRPAPQAHEPQHQEGRPAPPPRQSAEAQHHGGRPQPTPQQRQMAQTAWQSHRAENWQSQHRSWQQRGGYHGYRIPDDRYRTYFGPSHVFPIYSVPVTVVGGYPRFQYQGFWFTVVDPWPANWGNDWYYDDDVYIIYTDGGYYLCNSRYPGVMLAVNVAA